MLLVGAGGIGTHMAELLVAGLRRVNLQGSITLMDADIVEAGKFGPSTLRTGGHRPGQGHLHRRAAWTMRRPCVFKKVVQNLRREAQFNDYDLVVVCVDRPEPRRLVHGLKVPWLDVRCSGDGWMALSSEPTLLER